MKQTARSTEIAGTFRRIFVRWEWLLVVLIIAVGAFNTWRSPFFLNGNNLLRSTSDFMELGIMVLPHELRHAYATHCLDRGVNPKALQEAMGHEHIETTMGYCHADALSVPSPL